MMLVADGEDDEDKSDRVPPELFQDLMTIQEFSKMNKFMVRPLPYEMNGLEPVLSGDQMTEYLQKYNHCFVDNLNQLLKDTEYMLKKEKYSQLTELSNEIKYNVGGLKNYIFFWESLSPIKEDEMTPGSDTDLMKYIQHQWGDFESFKRAFSETIDNIEGASWAWLCYNKRSNTLEIRTTNNHGFTIDQYDSIVPLLSSDTDINSKYMEFVGDVPKFEYVLWKLVDWNRVANRLAEAKA